MDVERRPYERGDWGSLDYTRRAVQDIDAEDSNVIPEQTHQDAHPRNELRDKSQAIGAIVDTRRHEAMRRPLVLPEGSTTISSSRMATDGSLPASNECERNQFDSLQRVRTEWLQKIYHSGNFSSSPSPCPTGQTQTKALHIADRANLRIDDLTGADLERYMARLVKCSYKGPADADHCPVHNDTESKLVAGPTPDNVGALRRIYLGRNIRGPCPVRHQRWLAILWEAFQRAAQCDSYGDDITCIRASIHTIRHNIFFDYRTLQIYGLVVMSDANIKENSKMNAAEASGGSMLETSRGLAMDYLYAKKDGSTRPPPNTSIVEAMPNIRTAYRTLCRLWSSIKNPEVVPVTLDRSSEAKLRRMADDIRRKEKALIATSSPTGPVTLCYEEYITLFAKYLPASFHVPEDYSREDRPFSDNLAEGFQTGTAFEFDGSKGHTAGGSCETYGQKLVRDGYLGTELSCREVRAPGRTTSVLSHVMEPPGIGLAALEHRKNILEDNRINRAKFEMESAESRRAEADNSKLRAAMRAEAAVEIAQSVDKAASVLQVAALPSSRQTAVLDELLQVPPLVTLTAEEADVRMRFLANRKASLHEEQQCLASRIHVHEESRFASPTDGLRWAAGNGEQHPALDKWGYKRLMSHGYLSKSSKPSTMATEDVLQPGLCPLELRMEGNAADRLPEVQNYIARRQFLIEQRLSALRKEDDEIVKREAERLAELRRFRVAAEVQQSKADLSPVTPFRERLNTIKTLETFDDSSLYTTSSSERYSHSKTRSSGSDWS